VSIQGRPDIERYDVLKDVMRLERLVGEGIGTAGAALVLSNTPGFWSPSRSGRPTAFDAFRLDDGRTIAGQMRWGDSAGEGTRRLREAPLELNGTYELHWRPYSQLPGARRGELRYLRIIVQTPVRAARKSGEHDHCRWRNDRRYGRNAPDHPSSSEQ
jgi:hypothetical protein